MLRIVLGLLYWYGGLAWAEVAVPKALEDWRSWVLHGHEELRCPFLAGGSERFCVWPSELKLDAKPSGLSFTQKVELFSADWVVLPGSRDYWPQDVASAGQYLPVRDRDGLPEVFLNPGAYDITGQIAWKQLPRTLPIPVRTGLIGLTLNGKTVAAPSLEGPGQLWLTASPEEKAAQQDDLSLRVFRQLADGIPLIVTTRLELDVSGKERELQLGQFLLTGFTTRYFSSPLPARIDADGNLRVQVKPGSWVLELQAQSLTAKPVLQYHAATPLWPTQEIWVFAANSALRTLQINGVTSIDPSQTALPEPWKSLPAYVVEPDKPLQLEELFRGNPNPGRNALTLNREIWLDFNGSGFSFSDRIAGNLQESFRLDLAIPLELGRAVLDGQPQLITESEDGGARGIEVRRAQVQLDAQGRIPRMAEMPVAAWRTAFDSVNTQLYLPPGWSLLFASAQSVSNAWVNNWKLWDIFLVLVIVLTIGRVVNIRVGAVALICVLLVYQRPGAPVFIWLNIAAFLALLGLVSGAFKDWLTRYQLLSFVYLALVLLPFSVNETRYAVYPQLESGSGGGRHGFSLWGLVAGQEDVVEEAAITTRTREVRAPMAVAPAPVEEGEGFDQQAGPMTTEAVMMNSTVEKVSPSLKRKMVKSDYAGTSSSPSLATQYDPNQQVQTGPGLPEWSFHNISLSWSGPVAQTDTSRWLLVPPVINRLGHLLAALVPWLLAFMLWRALGVRQWQQLIPRSPEKGAGMALGIGLLIIGTCLPAPKLQADEVNPSLLKELEQRLTAAPACGEQCASLETVALQVQGDSLSLDIEVHAQTLLSLPLPAQRGGWSPSVVVVDGHRASVLADDTGRLLVSLSAGRHLLHLQGGLDGEDSFTLDFGLPLHNLQTQLAGWSLSGTPDVGRSSSTLHLQRQELSAASTASRLTPSPISPFVQVARRIKLGLEWTVETEVMRLAPETGVINLEVPLLPGEAPLSLQVNNNGRVAVSIGADQQSFSWTSRLKQTSPVQLTAAQNVPWAEVWSLDSAPIWHVELTGIPAQQLGQSAYQPQWLPWPGESVTLDISKPQAVQGNRFTLQNVTLTQKPGYKISQYELQLMVVSNQGGFYDFALPPASRLEQVDINGRVVALSHSEGQLKIPLKPGDQKIAIHWQSDQSIGLLASTPTLDLGNAARNIRLKVEMPKDRWLLLFGGPRMGPAMLFWGMLIVVVLLAIGLARTGKTPLKTYEWVLLSLGVCTVNLAILVLLAAWFVALHWRGQQLNLPYQTRFKLLQAGLFGLSILAILSLLLSIPQGLLSLPDMQIFDARGGGHYAGELAWYDDQSQGVLPQAWVLSVPVLVYRAAMLCWSLWLAFALLRWLKWGWTQLSNGNLWYRELPTVIQPAASEPPPPLAE